MKLKVILFLLTFLHSCNGRTDVEYITDMCQTEQDTFTKQLKKILHPREVTTTGSFPKAFLYGSSDMDWFVVGDELSHLTHQEGSDEVYQALKNEYPGAELKTKEMGRQLITIPTPRSRCSTDIDVTYIPRLCSDEASTRVIQGHLLSKMKTHLWATTVANDTEVSKAVKILKAASKIVRPTPPSYVTELAILYLDKILEEPTTDSNDLIRGLKQSLEIGEGMCLRAQTCVCEKHEKRLCYQPYGTALLPIELSVIIDVLNSNQDLKMMFPDSDPTSQQAARRLAVAIVCRKKWDPKTREDRMRIGVDPGAIARRMEDIYAPFKFSNSQVENILVRIGFTRVTNSNSLYEPTKKSFDSYCTEVESFHQEF